MDCKKRRLTEEIRIQRHGNYGFIQLLIKIIYVRMVEMLLIKIELENEVVTLKFYTYADEKKNN